MNSICGFCAMCMYIYFRFAIPFQNVLSGKIFLKDCTTWIMTNTCGLVVNELRWLPLFHNLALALLQVGSKPYVSPAKAPKPLRLDITQFRLRVCSVRHHRSSQDFPLPLGSLVTLTYILGGVKVALSWP